MLPSQLACATVTICRNITTMNHTFEPEFVSFFDWASEDNRYKRIHDLIDNNYCEQKPFSLHVDCNGEYDELVKEIILKLNSTIEFSSDFKTELRNFLCKDFFENNFQSVTESLINVTIQLKMDYSTFKLIELTDEVGDILLLISLENNSDVKSWKFQLEGTQLLRCVDLENAKLLEETLINNFLPLLREQQTLTMPTDSSVRESNKNSDFHNKRGAVYDTVDLSMPYVPKIFEKDESVSIFLASVVLDTILFDSFSGDERIAVVQALEKHPVLNTGEVIIKQGDLGEFFYIIESGFVSVYIETMDSKQVKIGRNLGRGDSFGELALMYNTPRAATVISNSPVVLWRISRQTYKMIVMHHKQRAAEERLELLKSVQILGKKLMDVLSVNELNKVVNSLEEEEYDAGSVIIRQNQAGDYFYIIKEGTVEVFQKTSPETNDLGRKVADLGPGNYFGEKALLADDVRQASCVAVGKVVCLSLSRDEFISMIGSWQDITKEYAGSSAINDGKTVSHSDSGYLQSFPSTVMDLADVEQLRVIGVGAFGRVRLARNNKTGEAYAMKCLSKHAIIKKNLQSAVLNEMKLMQCINSSSVIKLHCTLQDSRYVYFVLDLLSGGDFFSLLSRLERLTEDQAKFYSAPIISAFYSLHSKKIAYRDLKPENMVLDSRGFVKLVDLGLAKRILNGYTWTMCGTPDYLAPEIVQNQGHNFAVDYWSLGVLLYEMHFGWPPFYSDEPMKIYEKIIACQVSYPSSFSKHLVDICGKLMKKNALQRLGNMRGGIADIVKHKWFGSFDWQGLENRTIVPPYVPSIENAFDTSHFDSFDEEPIEEVECEWTLDL